MRIAPIVSSTVGGSISIAIFVGFCVCFFTCILPSLKGRPLRSKKVYVNAALKFESNISDAIFISGTYASYYYQDKKYHGPFDIKLGFYPSAGNIVHGGGKDDVGTYIIVGIYSPRTLRMSLEKRYQLGTGNPEKNLGHSETIQVKWKHSNQDFEGKWYRRTTLDHSENKFLIQYEGADD